MLLSGVLQKDYPLKMIQTSVPTTPAVAERPLGVAVSTGERNT